MKRLKFKTDEELRNICKRIGVNLYIISENQKAFFYFNKRYQNYIRKYFNVNIYKGY